MLAFQCLSLIFESYQVESGSFYFSFVVLIFLFELFLPAVSSLVYLFAQNAYFVGKILLLNKDRLISCFFLSKKLLVF